MEIVRDDDQLTRYIRDAVQVSGDNPVLLDRYLANAVEVDVDALSDGRAVHVAGVMEHIEEAGVHSGDSACSLPPYTLTPATIAELKRQTESLALALGVVGLMNVQFAIQNGDIYVLEVNPRASRTVPFVAKATDSAIAAIAARIMAGEPLSHFPLRPPYPEGVGPDDPLPFADPMTLADPAHPLVLGQGSGHALQPLPRRRHPARPRDALDRRGHGLGPHLPPRLPESPARRRHRAARPPAPSSSRSRTPTRTACSSKPPALMHELGFRLARHRRHRPVPRRPQHPRHPRQQGLRGPPPHRRPLKDGGVQIVFNTTEGTQSIADSRAIRTLTLSSRIPYYTTAAGARAAALAMQDRLEGDLRVRSLQG